MKQLILYSTEKEVYRILDPDISPIALCISPT